MMRCTFHAVLYGVVFYAFFFKIYPGGNFMTGRTKTTFSTAGADAHKKEASSASSHALRERSMSVDDFRRLVQELYLEPESSATLLPADAPTHNVAILVDTSGSMEHHDPHLTKLKSSLEEFAARLAAYAGQGIRLNVCLIGFSEKITAFFTAEAFTEFTAQPDDPLYKTIHDLRACGGTNYQAAFHKAGAWFAEYADEHSTSAIFFITDGKPTCYYHDAFSHSIAPSKSGAYVCNGAEFVYSGRGRVYYDAPGHAVSGNSGARRYRASEDGVFEVRVGSSMNWSRTSAVFAPDSQARRVNCTLPEYYVPGQSHYFDASGNKLSEARGAAYRVSASGHFEQYRKGAWHEPAGAVIATALNSDGGAHAHLTTKVQGGNGVNSGELEAGKSLLAYRDIVEKTQRLSVHAIGIGSAVDASMLNSFDSAAHAQILFETGQLAAALAAIAHSDFSSVLPELQAQSPQDVFPAHDHSAEIGMAMEDVPHHAAPGEAGEHATAFHGDGSLLSELGNALLGDDSALIPDDAFSPAPQDHAALVRHVSLENNHLNLHDLFGEAATVDDLLARITTSQETRIVNGETVGDLVLHLHAGVDARTPVVQTIVLEGFTQADSDSPDLQHLLHHLLHS
jgi:Mg-chelatase subunit ChlD